MSRRIALSILTVGLLASTSAWARNPHVSGGIQYYSLAQDDKTKGNLDDYKREISKAVAQLEQGTTEDPKDLEGFVYLGLAYADVDSANLAGKAYATAIEGMKAKGDKKGLDMALQNRESAWVSRFNMGVADIRDAQGLYPSFAREPANDAEKTAKAAALKKYQDALGVLNGAIAIKPEDPRAYRSVGSVYALMGDYQKAETAFQQGLKAAPADSELAVSMRTIKVGRANDLLDAKKWDEALSIYQDAVKSDPNNADLWTGIGSAAFGKAQTLDGDARAAEFKTAADAYAKAAGIRANAPELHYNAAVGYQNGNDEADAETEFRAVLKLKPEDADALTGLSGILADQKKFPEAISMAQKAVSLDPKDKDRHRQLGAIYNKAQDNLHSKQALLAYLALDKGAPADKPTDASGAAGAKVLSSMGKPDQILLWDADGQKYETWFYWTKGQAYHFGGGSQLEKTDWSAALASK